MEYTCSLCNISTDYPKGTEVSCPTPSCKGKVGITYTADNPLSVAKADVAPAANTQGDTNA